MVDSTVVAVSGVVAAGGSKSAVSRWHRRAGGHDARRFRPFPGVAGYCTADDLLHKPSTNASARAQRRGSGDARGCPSRDRDSAGIWWFPGAARRSGSVACSRHCHPSRVFHKRRVRLPGTIRMARWRVAPLPARAAMTPCCCSTPAPVGARQEHRHQPPKPPSPRSVATGTAPPAGAASRDAPPRPARARPQAHTPSSPVAANRTAHQDRAANRFPAQPRGGETTIRDKGPQLPPAWEHTVKGLAATSIRPGRTNDARPSPRLQPDPADASNRSSIPSTTNPPPPTPPWPAHPPSPESASPHDPLTPNSRIWPNHQPDRPTRAPADYTAETVEPII